MDRALEEQKLAVPPPASASAESIVTEAVSILKKATVSSEGDVKQVQGVPKISHYIKTCAIEF